MNGQFKQAFFQQFQEICPKIDRKLCSGVFNASTASTLPHATLLYFAVPVLYHTDGTDLR